MMCCSCPGLSSIPSQQIHSGHLTLCAFGYDPGRYAQHPVPHDTGGEANPEPAPEADIAIT